MFSSSRDITEFNNKRDALITRLHLQASISNKRNKKYEAASIFDETFALPSSNTLPSNSIGTQTESSPAPTPSTTNQTIGTQTMTNVLRYRPSTRDSSTDTNSFQEEDAQTQSRLLQEHRDAINHSNSIILQQNTELNALRDQINEMTQYFNQEYRNAENQFNQLLHENHLSHHQINLLKQEFELGRQLYLNLQTAYDNIMKEGTINLEELNNLKKDYAMGEELYNTLKSAYECLQKEAGDYKQEIAKLEEVKAFQTARILEQQSEMLKNTVPDKTAKQMRSRNNTVEALRKFLIEKNIEEAPAATTTGRVSKKYIFVIKNGKLYKRAANKPDIDLEENTPAATNGLVGLDPIWTMISVKHGILPGVGMAKNELLRAEADALRQGGKPLTHKEGQELRNQMDDPMGETTPKRDRTPSLYMNFSPNLETKRKQLKGTGLKAPCLYGAGHTSLIVKYRELGGCLINLQALHGGKLSLRKGCNIKQMCGKVIDLSDELKDVIKTLVYDGKIDKEAYNQLTLSDKRVFDKLLNKSSLVYNEKNWDDPQEVLIEEYNKLKGEIEIGNDNPDIKKKLRKVITTLYSSGIINEKNSIKL